MFDFLTNALNNTLGLIPDNLNPMNLIPEGVKNLGGLLGDATQVVDPGTLAPQIRDVVRQQMANQVRDNNPIGQLTGTQTGRVGDKVQGYISAETGLPVITSGSPAFNQGIFAPNLDPNINPGILGDIYPQINQVDPLFAASLKATTKPEKDTEVADADGGDDEKKEKDRAKMINDILAAEAQRQRDMSNIEPMDITQPTASAGSSAPVLDLTPQQMITIANNRRNNTFGILG